MSCESALNSVGIIHQQNGSSRYKLNLNNALFIMYINLTEIKMNIYLKKYLTIVFKYLCMLQIFSNFAHNFRTLKYHYNEYFL